MPPIFPIDNSSDEDIPPDADDWLASGPENDVEIIERNRPPGSDKRKATNNDASYLTKRLRDTDAQLNEMHADMQALRREMAVMTVQKGPAQKSQLNKARGSTSSTRQSNGDSDTPDHPEQDVDTADKEEMKRVHQFGAKFSTMYVLWLGNARAAFRTKPDPEYTPEECFNGDLECKRQGKYADILEVLPEEYHNQFFGNIYKIFDHGMSVQRSNTVTRLRKVLGPRIFDAPPESFQKPDWRYDNYRILAGWSEDAKGQAFYTPFAPILYRDYRGRPDVNNVFLNEALFKVFAVIIRGPSALDFEPGVRTAGKPTQEGIWELTEVTPGAIAASAIYARYTISKDTMFQRQGALTNIDYDADFHTYLRYLTVGLTKKKQSIMRILKTWDEYFFPSKTGLDNQTVVAPDQATDAIFAALDEESDSDRDNLDDTSVRSQPPPPTGFTNFHDSSLVVHANVVVGRSPSPEGDVPATSANSRLHSISELETTSSLTTATKKGLRQPRARPAAEPNRRSLRSRVGVQVAVIDAVATTNDSEPALAELQDDEGLAKETGKGKGKGKGPGSRKGKN